ncbi:MAG: MFS transporter [Candidatus Rokuibacteriota bacterium]|nr:MAG: MFS transporter [Candidatus Rokubacteria bacterium]
MTKARLFYGWVVVGASALIICIGMGILFSLGVFLTPIEESLGWSRSAISSVALINWVAMGLGSFLWGSLSDRIGTRIVAVSGGLLLGLGMVLSSQVSSLWQFSVTFGVMVGFAVGAFYAPLSATATKWFTRNRGLAVSIVSAGIGLGTFVIAPLARWLTSTFDWRLAMLLIGDLAWLVVIPVALVIKNAPGDLGIAALGGTSRPDEREFDARDVLSSPQFWLIALAHFACCAAHSGPIFHMVTHAIDQGVPQMVAASVLGVSGLASIAGRIGCGVLADIFGAKRTLVAGLAVQAVMVALYLGTRGVGGFYALALGFGVAYGGVMPLYALLIRQYFGEKIMGTAYGGVFLVSTLGMGLGSFAGGVISDQLGSYTWLFISSFAIGTAAALVALSFRPPRAVAPVLEVAAASR